MLHLRDAGELLGVCGEPGHVVRRLQLVALAARLLRQYLHSCTSKASTLGTRQLGTTPARREACRCSVY